MLEMAAVEAGYGRAPVLRDFSLRVEAGEIVTLIGSNGAGKSTTLRAISGLVPVRRGAIRFNGEALTHRGSHAVVRAGVAHVPEGRRLFADMTVRENLVLGGYTCPRRELNDRLARVYEWFPRLGERTHQLAGSLSGGEQQMVAIGRALMARPKLLLMDEPSLGLAPVIVDEVFDRIERVRAEGVSVVLVEQNVKRALDISTRAYVLAEGRIVQQGSAAELAASPEVVAALLGV